MFESASASRNVRNDFEGAEGDVCVHTDLRYRAAFHIADIGFKRFGKKCEIGFAVVESVARSNVFYGVNFRYGEREIVFLALVKRADFRSVYFGLSRKFLRRARYYSDRLQRRY